MLGRAAGLRHAGFHVGIEFAPGGDVARRGKDRLGGFGRELAAGIGGAGLNDDRPALDRAGDIERPAHRQIRALVIEYVQLIGIEKETARRVTDESVVGPRIPQPGHHVVELAGAAIALAVLHVIVHAEIQRGIGIGRGHDIPAGAAAAEMIERSETPGDVVGRIERGRAGGHEAQMLGHHRQRRQQRERLERRHRMAVLERVERHVQHGQMIGHEKRVEFGALQRLRETLEMGEIEIGVGEGAGITPGAGMDCRRAHESAETQLT